MAKLEVYRRKTTPSAGQIAPRLSPGEEARTGLQIAKAGEQLTNIGAQMQEASNYKELKVAQVNHAKGRAEIADAWQNDPNLDDADVQKGYMDQFNALGSTVLEGVKNDRVKSQITAEFELANIQNQTQMKKVGRNIMFSKGKAATTELLDMMKDQYATADKKVKGQLLGVMSREIGMLESKGFITAEQAVTLEKKHEKEWIESALTTLIANDIDEAERQIVDGDIPLDSEEKVNQLKIIETARASRARKAERKITAAQKENGVSLGEDILTGEKGIVDVILQTNALEVTPEMASSAFEYLTIDSGVEHMKTDPASWNHVMENMFDPKLNMEKFFGILMEADLTGKDGQALLMWAKEGYDFIADQKVVDPKWEQFNTTRQEMNKFVGSLFGMPNNKNAADALFGMTKSLFEQVTNGTLKMEDIQKRGEELMGQEVIKNVPGAQNLPKSGGVFMDTNGNQVKIYPTGVWEEIE